MVGRTPAKLSDQERAAQQRSVRSGRSEASGKGGDVGKVALYRRVTTAWSRSVVAGAVVLAAANATVADEGAAYEHLYEVMDKYHLAFDVYTDRDAGGNHFHPTAWYNGDTNMALDTDWRDDPHSGCSCTRVHWTGDEGADGWLWNGVMWQEPEDHSGSGDPRPGYDLTGATELTFWARADEPGLGLIVGMGYPYDTSGEVRETVWLDTTWAMYEIALPEGVGELADIHGGFSFAFNDGLDPDPHGCTFYLDDIRYNLARPDSLRLLLSYVTDCSAGDREWAVNQAYTYDNALAMLALLARGTSEDLRRARIIGDAFLYAQEHDRHHDDGRLRNAYSSGDIANHITGYARLPGWWDDDSLNWYEDDYQVGSYTGEMAWVTLAWLTYDDVTRTSTYLQPAETLGEWIHTHCLDSNGIAGYTGGYLGPDSLPQKEDWKSTEHNLDVFVAFSRLFEATGDSMWLDRAQIAWDFVGVMWDSASTHFWAGTTTSVDVNYFSPLDAQAWAALASRGGYCEALSWAEDGCGVDTLGYSGFHFSTVCDGIWWEGTAQMCCAYQRCNEPAKADTCREYLRLWQANAPNGNGKGISACLPDSIWTGIWREWGKWYYHDRLHIGATSWYVFAEREYNAYWNEPTKPCEGVPGGVGNPGVPSLGRGHPNPFSRATTMCYSLPEPSTVKLHIYNLRGQLISTLFDGPVGAGTHSVSWDAAEAAPGIYVCDLEAGRRTLATRLVLVR